MLKRAILLQESDINKLKEALNIIPEPISFSYLSEINNDVHFALSYLKDKKLNEMLRKYFKIYIQSMINFYEYKETDKIIAVKKDQQGVQLFLLKVVEAKPARILLNERA